jgi:hypothetical protein
VSDIPFAILCLIIGAVCVFGLPFLLFAPLDKDEGLIARVLMILFLISLGSFLWSLGGTGIALALGWSRLTHVLEGVAVISGSAALLIPLPLVVYGTVRSLIRRRAST